MDYNEYLEKHPESIFHYCLPAKPGDKVLVINPYTEREEYLPAKIQKYLIYKDGVDIELYLESTGVRFYRPIREFGKTIFIGSVVEE